jgi:hypothetical protein
MIAPTRYVVFCILLCCMMHYCTSLQLLSTPGTKHTLQNRWRLKAGFGEDGVSKKITPTSKKEKKPLDTPPPKKTIGVTPDEALLKQYCPSIDLNYKGVRLIHEDPVIFEIDNFLDAAACDAYIQLALDEGDLFTSATFSSIGGSTRTSSTYYMQYGRVPEFIGKLKNVLGKDIFTFEEPQLVRYEMGQQFSWHYDALPASMVDEAGQRVATLIVYLNDVDLGGATVFKELGPLQVKPVKGKALLFFPCDQQGVADDRTMHAGQVCMDTKWIAQTWVRQRAYTPTVPNVGTQQAGVNAVDAWTATR